MYVNEAGTLWEDCAAAGSWQNLWREKAVLVQVCWKDL